MNQKSGHLGAQLHRFLSSINENEQIAKALHPLGRVSGRGDGSFSSLVLATTTSRDQLPLLYSREGIYRLMESQPKATAVIATSDESTGPISPAKSSRRLCDCHQAVLVA
jgi:hypothetical protein